MPKPLSIALIIAAGGVSRRFGGDTPKQFTPILGIPALGHCVQRFMAARGVSSLIVAAARKYRKRCRQICNDALKGTALAWELSSGGETRFESVLGGLAELKLRIASHGWPTPDVVLIHDAARPCVTAPLAEAVAAAALRTGAAVAAIPESATLKEIKPGDGEHLFVQQTIPRDKVWQAQTPQGLRWPMVFDLFERAAAENVDVTDDVQIAERYDVEVEIVPGSASNIKITHPDDIRVAEAFLRD
jgi:2-C-methyl-D-erythritol 4-phosphate cytidylyltransferase